MVTLMAVLAQAAVSLISSLVAGKTVKVALYKMIRFFTSRTKTKADDEVLDNIKIDWGLTDHDIDPEGLEKKDGPV